MSDDNIIKEKVIYQPSSTHKNFNGNYEKYLEKLFRTFKDDARATRPDVVGQLTELLDESSADTYSEWEDYYQDNYLDDNPNAIQNAVDRVVNYLQGTINNRLESITKEDVREWVQMLLYYRSPTGMLYESSILTYIADQNDLKYGNSTSKEETQGIDGYLDGKAVQVKPESYEHGGTTREMPSVETIVYEVQDKTVRVNTEQLSVIDNDTVTVSVKDVQDSDTDNPWLCDMDQGYEKIINEANETARANRKTLVGDISEMTDMCPYDDVDRWVRWYQNTGTDLNEEEVGFRTPVDNPVEDATESTYEMIENWRELTENVDQYRDQIESMIWRLIVFETHDGLSVEQSIFDHLSGKYDANYTDSTSGEESKNIDGYLDDTPIQVKPESYDRADVGINIDPVIVTYNIGNKYIKLQYDESRIIDSS